MCGLTSGIRARLGRRRKGVIVALEMPQEPGLGPCIRCGTRQEKRCRCEMRSSQVICKDCCIDSVPSGHECDWWDLCW